MTRRPASGHVARRELTAQPRSRTRIAVGLDEVGRVGVGGTRADAGLEERHDVDLCDEVPFGYARPERWR